MVNAGDCGSWVVDPSTCEVYGHVVASDAMGDSYVVPFNAILRDMEEKLAAVVSLPTEADIDTWLTQQTEAGPEQIIVPANSKKKNVSFNDSENDKVHSRSHFQKPAKHGLPAPSAVKSSTKMVINCDLCNAECKGTSQNVTSVLLRHRGTCSKQNKDAARRIESPTPQDAKDSLDQSQKLSSVMYSGDVKQKIIDHKSTRQASPVPLSLRSMYSSFRRKSDDDSRQKDENKGKNVSNPKDKNSTGSASSTKIAPRARPISATKELKTTTKKSDPKKDFASPPIDTGLSTPTPSLAGRPSSIFSSVPIPGRRSSLDATTPLLPRVLPLFPKHGKVTALPPRPPPQAPPRINESDISSRHRSGNGHLEHVSYEGYTFTKCGSHYFGQKETWAIALMLPMPASQEDLKDQVKRNKKKHSSALAQYNDEKMKGFKKKQVDNLIRQRTKLDGDYGYEYVLASIKLESRKTKGKMDTVSMQVILKRQQLEGFPHEPSAGPSINFHPKLPEQVMDLTRGDELGKSRSYSGDSHDVGHGVAVVPYAGHPHQGAFPVYPGHPQYFEHGVQHIDNIPPLFYPAPLPFDPIYSPAQVTGQYPHSQTFPLVNKELHDTQGRPEKSSKSNQKKKAPKIVDQRHEYRKKQHYSSDSSSHSDHSIGFDSDNSMTKTDATPDTIVSAENSEYREEKKYEKEDNERFHNRDRIMTGTPSTHKTDTPVYHEHRRIAHRHSSVSPARGGRDLSPEDSDLDLERHRRKPTSLRYHPRIHYHDDEYCDIEPATSFPSNRAQRHRRGNVSPEGFPHHQASSYNLDHPLTYDSRALIPMYHQPTEHRGTTWDSSRAADSYSQMGERPRGRGSLDGRGLHRSREGDEEWARSAGRARELDRGNRRRERETERREREIHEREIRDARLARRENGIWRSEMNEYESRGWPRGPTYAEPMPRHRREGGYYY